MKLRIIKQVKKFSWFRLLLIIFIAKGLLIASIGPAWYGEDEPSHFGYIESLARNRAWYSFSDNYASIDARIAKHLMSSTLEPQWALIVLQSVEFKQYREYASHHRNATAYQAPLFYWIFSQFYKLCAPLSILSILYLARYLNVGIGALYLINVHWLSLQLLTKDRDRVLMTSFIGFLPLLALLSATVTVQVTVFLLYSLIFSGLLIGFQNPVKGYGIAISATIAGLLTQQAFMVAPILVILSLAYDYAKKDISLKRALIITGMMAIGLIGIFPQLYKRHMETSYTSIRSETAQKLYTPMTYLPTQWKRIQVEVIDGFWDQKRSFVPYYASSRVKNGLKIITVLASIGFLDWLARSKKSLIEKRWIFMSGIIASLFIAGHFWFDYHHTLQDGQEYMKARYYFPLLPIVSWAWAKGLTHLFSKSNWWNAIYTTVISLLLLAQGTAIAWLMIAIGTR